MMGVESGREALQAVDAAGWLVVGPGGPLALILLAGMHGAATQIADGATATELGRGLLKQLTRSSRRRVY